MDGFGSMTWKGATARDYYLVPAKRHCLAFGKREAKKGFHPVLFIHCRAIETRSYSFLSEK